MEGVMYRALITTVALAAVASANAVVYTFGGHLTGAQEVPPNQSNGFGVGSISINTANWSYLGSITVTGISLANLTMYHVHYGPVGVNGPIIIDIVGNEVHRTGDANGFTVSFAGTVGTSAGMTPQQKLDHMRASNTYFNVHTLQFPGGEIRGQIYEAVPEPATMAALGLGVFTLVRRRRKS
jgi:hypothetical protein